MNLENKNALITGGAKRLGRAVALALAERGVNIAIHYNHSKEEAVALSKEINANGLKCTLVGANCEKIKEVQDAVKKSAEALGGLDILINNAAIFFPTPLKTVSEKDWDNHININTKAPFFFAREFALLGGKSLRKIINMADGYGSSPSPNFIPYGISKAGVIALTKGLAKALAPDILVNCICPGPILRHENIELTSHQKVVTRTLLKREGTPEDIVKTVIFLLESDYITGQEIYVDGGRWV